MNNNPTKKDSRKFSNTIVNILIFISVIALSAFSFIDSKQTGNDVVIKNKIQQFNMAIDIYLKTEGKFPLAKKDSGYSCIAPEGEKCYFEDIELEAESLVGTDFEVFLSKRGLFNDNSVVSASDVVKDYIDYEIESLPVIEVGGEKYGGGIIYWCIEKEGEDCVAARIYDTTKNAIETGNVVAQANYTQDNYGDPVDCNGTVNGDAVEDDCGVCGGDGSTCICDQYNLCESNSDCPPDYRSDGSQLYTCQSVRDIDLGGGETCTAKQCYCSTCSGGGGGSCPQGYDVCGLCGGTETDPNNCGGCTVGYDQCGVCGGNNSTCSDCAGVPYGDTKVDQCGVCGGDNSTCLDCNGVPNGGAVLDACNVCNGDGSTCADCNGVPNGGAVLDACNVCGGDGTGCDDCNGIPNGGAVLDACNVCNGDGSTCADCNGVPNGGAVLDACNVCGGDGSTCNNADANPECTNPGNDPYINITWGDTDGEAGYNILRDGSHIATALPVNSSSYDDNDVSGGVSYTYQIEYYDGSGTTYSDFYDELGPVTARNNCGGTNTDNCGSAHDVKSIDRPNSNLCSPSEGGVSVTANSSSGNWEWECNSGSSECSADIDAVCGSSNGDIITDEPSSGLCATGSMHFGSVREGNDEWSWDCISSDANNDGVQTGVQCSASCANGQVIDGGVCTNTLIIDNPELDPRVVKTDSDTCTIGFDLQVPVAGLVTCDIINNNGDVIESNKVNSVLAAGTYGPYSHSNGVVPRRSYIVSCKYDEGSLGDITLVKSDPVACILNPTFSEF